MLVYRTEARQRSSAVRKVLRQLPARGWFVENASYAAFFDALLDGRLALGQTLTQDALCAVLDTSLSPLRETLTLLEADGLISIRRRIGVTIFYPDVAFVRSTFQFRGMIEREAIRKVVTAGRSGMASGPGGATPRGDGRGRGGG